MAGGHGSGEGSAVLDRGSRAEEQTPVDRRPARDPQPTESATASSTGPNTRRARSPKKRRSTADPAPQRKPRPSKFYVDGVARSLTPREARQMAVVYGISVGLHLLIAAALALYVFEPEAVDEVFGAITSEMAEEQEPIEVVEIAEPEETPEQIEEEVAPVETVAEVLEPTESPVDLNPEIPEPAVPDVPVDESAPAPSADVPEKGELAGRASGRAKKALLEARGGNEASEQAVARGLEWLASIQRPDGSWSWDDTGPGSKPGTLRNAPNGATGLALLAFLGAGHTPLEGSYDETVLKGLVYLTKGMQPGPGNTGDLGDKGSSSKNARGYTHAIATLALCESYALCKTQLELDEENAEDGGRKTRRERIEARRERREEQLQRVKAERFVAELRDYAQLAVNFCVHAQEPKGGGWRYEPGQPGDTSATGWYLMALQSARAGGLAVPVDTLRRGSRFLDGVSAEGGAKYGYGDGKTVNSTRTSVGLLCRMYLGWTPENNPALAEGVAYIAETGPSLNDMYYTYYATQVLHHWGGEKWTAWNERNRDSLVAAQVANGPAAGSWPPGGGHGPIGGSLLQTCFSVMTLEVYYRHLPLYRRSQVQGDF